jgi:hypothetical protein
MGVIKRYTIEMASDGMTYIPSFMKTGSGILVILWLLPQQLLEVVVLVLLMTGIEVVMFVLLMTGIS